MIERSRENGRFVGNLNQDLAPQIQGGELSEPVRTEIERLGVSSSKLTVVGQEGDDATSVWHLSPSSWSSPLTPRPSYQLRVSPDRLELYDCNVAVRAFTA